MVKQVWRVGLCVLWAFWTHKDTKTTSTTFRNDETIWKHFSLQYFTTNTLHMQLVFQVWHRACEKCMSLYGVCVCVMLYDVSRANHWNLKTRAPCKRSAQAPPPLSDLEMFLAAGNKVGKSHQLRRRRASRLRQRLFSRSAEWQADKTGTVVLRPRKRTVCCCWSFSQSVAIKSKYRYVTVRWNPRLNVLKELKSARVNKHKPEQWHTPPLRSLLFSHTHPKCGGLIPFFFQLTFLIMKGKLSRLLPASPRAPAASQHWLIQRSQWNHKCLHMETSLILFSFPSPSRHE